MTSLHHKQQNQQSWWFLSIRGWTFWHVRRATLTLQSVLGAGGFPECLSSIQALFFSKTYRKSPSPSSWPFPQCWLKPVVMLGRFWWRTKGRDRAPHPQPFWSALLFPGPFPCRLNSWLHQYGSDSRCSNSSFPRAVLFPSSPKSLWFFSLPQCSQLMPVLFSKSTCASSASDSPPFLLKGSFEPSWFQLLCHIWLSSPCPACSKVSWQCWMGELAPISAVSAKRAEKQQDCTKCLIRAIPETAVNEIKLLGLDPSQCKPWGADTAICTLIYWALELFNVWFMVVNCVLANVHCAKLSVPSPIKYQGLIHVKASWWVHYILDQSSGSQWQIIFHFCPIFLLKRRRGSSVFHQCFYVYFWENPHGGSGYCDIERMTHSDI